MKTFSQVVLSRIVAVLQWNSSPIPAFRLSNLLPCALPTGLVLWVAEWLGSSAVMAGQSAVSAVHLKTVLDQSSSVLA